MHITYPPLTSDYYSQQEINNLLTSMSGGLVLYIDQQDTTDRAYTDQRDLTTSGTIIAYINTVSGDLTSYVNSQYTSLYDQIVSTSGSIINYIDQRDNYVLGRITTTSGDIVNWVSAQNYTTLNQLTTTSGDLKTYIDSKADTTSISGTGGITATQSGSVWYINGSGVTGTGTGTTTSGAVVLTGADVFTSSGTSTIIHNLNSVNHYTSVTLMGSSAYNADQVSKVGTIYVQTGINQDNIYANGETYASGIAFNWLITSSGATSLPSSSSSVTAADIILTGSGSARPAAGTAGRLYLPTDGYYTSRDNGSSWDTYIGGGFKCSNPPAPNTLTAVNQTHSTLVVDGDGLLLTVMGSNNNTEYNETYLIAVPASPYTFTVGLELLMLWPINYAGVGICLTAGTATTDESVAFTIHGQTGASPISTISKQTNYVQTSDYVSQLYPFAVPSKLFLRFRDDATTRYTEMSINGRVWNLFHSVGRTDWITPTHCGLITRQLVTTVGTNITRAQAKIFHWSLA